MNDIKYGRKRSGIKRQLKLKIEEWLESITDEAVRKIAKDNTIVTGGSIASMLLGEQVNDYDVYFRTKASAVAVANYYVEKYNKAKKADNAEGVNPLSTIPVVTEGVTTNIRGEEEERVLISIKSAGVVGEAMDTYKYFESRPEEETTEFVESLAPKEEGEKYRVTFMSQNAITLSGKIQIIIRFFGEPAQIHDNYDFVHACCYWDHAKGDLYFHPEAMECLLSRTLVYHGSLYPIASIFRMKKFIERGWRITAAQQLKIMWQISEVDMTDGGTLQEQLTGVDMAYMHQLIEALKGVEPEKIDSTYVGKIIDRIFD